MLRRSLAALLAPLVVCALVALGLPAPASAAEVHPEWGSTSAPDGVLKKGCKRYPYSYAITPPEGYWSLEIFLQDRRGRHVAFAYHVYGDPLAATRTFKLCKASTRPGRFTMTALLSVEHGTEYAEGWLPPSHFRLRRR